MSEKLAGREYREWWILRAHYNMPVKSEGLRCVEQGSGQPTKEPHWFFAEWNTVGEVGRSAFATQKEALERQAKRIEQAIKDAQERLKDVQDALKAA